MFVKMLPRGYSVLGAVPSLPAADSVEQILSAKFHTILTTESGVAISRSDSLKKSQHLVVNLPAMTRLFISPSETA